MKLLLDTNIFLEVILGQQAADEARSVLNSANAHDLFVSDFSIHSIGLLLFRRGQHTLFQTVIQDLIRGSVTPIGVTAENLQLLAGPANKFGLDFDDAYQYVAADLRDLQIVSFDTDFDRTERGRLTPSQVLAGS